MVAQSTVYRPCRHGRAGQAGRLCKAWQGEVQGSQVGQAMLCRASQGKEGQADKARQ